MHDRNAADQFVSGHFGAIMIFLKRSLFCIWAFLKDGEHNIVSVAKWTALPVKKPFMNELLPFFLCLILWSPYSPVCIQSPLTTILLFLPVY
jgi:hypothetical protein